MMYSPRKHRQQGHNLLEAIVATGLFILVAVALSGVWVMYGKALTKSGEHLAANHLARSLTEGLMANGYDWLLANPSGPTNNEFLLERSVRGRDSSIKYILSYNATELAGKVDPRWPRDMLQLDVTVRWNSPAGGTEADPDYGQSLSYSTRVFKRALE